MTISIKFSSRLSFFPVVLLQVTIVSRSVTNISSYDVVGFENCRSVNLRTVNSQPVFLKHGRGQQFAGNIYAMTLGSFFLDNSRSCNIVDASLSQIRTFHITPPLFCFVSKVNKISKISQK